ncbi:SecD/SecF fusion protein [Cnuella takakiae]|uniref:Multifunctional fusion protein n=1 Tax=Cnuella takakiae TaxID=1302690 RepID=A0A1M4Y3E1_9BACT|nr:protein translocase subunit SecDF [Cnuella takakiae]OLY93034.1 protein translocase subunit SecDF [Cnuella takakiae]SHF00199.1 SecD/SecF fusion protein [Cnuella takakiae]
MQLKGLVRFFTILLILYSFYELSFTWVVRSHERKLEAQANSYVAANLSNADAATKELAYKERLRRLLDSTKDETVHYGIQGAITYQQAKENELNLGLDLQGGINVTMEVELSGLLRSMSNNSKDPNFLKALDNANARKANSNADYVTLFVEEYKKLAPNGRLAALFANSSNENIKINASDDAVVTEIRKEATEAFNRTFRVLRTRIDQFGVAQPNINPDPARGVINVELPGVQDQERVRKYLQSSANLQFWEVYNISELGTSIGKADEAFNTVMGGKSAPVADTTANPAADTTAIAATDTAAATAKADTGVKLSDALKQQQPATAAKNNTDTARKTLWQYISFMVNPQTGQAVDNGQVGLVAIRDTGIVRTYLQNPAIAANFPADIQWAYGIPETGEQNKKNNFVALYALKTKGNEKAPLEGEAVIEARADFNPTTNQPEVTMKMNAAGARTWANLTRANKGKFIAIVLDNIVYSAPRVNDAIEGGSSSISGSFTPEESTDLANILKAGKLPAPAKIVAEQVVGPTLGADAIQGGIWSFVISFAVIFILMLVYYNTSGWVANIALILNLLFTIGVLTGLGATLTAPGIAGLVLTIGMAVDTNVLIYERIKEELTRGKNYQQAINDGYRRSLPPVLDGHITTLLTAIILFSFGLGPVKGFATTQILGLLLSLFCGIAVSRWVSDIFTNKKRHLEYFTPISRRIFKHANYKFIEKRKIAYIISVVVLVLGIASFIHGFDYGVEFKGGRSYIVKFDQAANVENVRADLEKVFGESPVIKTIGGANQLDITTAYRIDDNAGNADSLVENTLFTGLRNHVKAQTYQQFDDENLVGRTKVLPTISDDLKAGAQWATFWSVLIIAIYIFIRFRDWRYSLGTIVALLHDVLVTLIVFSFLKDVVPFPLEIDQHFIAAILTVIGFSMNDTVVIFDRIREYSRQMIGAPKGEIINRAINDTLSRTIMTSLTVFLTILILFLVGGEVTRGFAFAMLIGVLVGIYSSVFVAAPVLVDLGSKKALGSEDKVAEPAAKQPAVAKS